MPAVIRYPGSKAKLASMLRQAMPDWMRNELRAAPPDAWYVEPFFGSGSAGLEVLEHASKSIRVWVNDADPGIYALWQSVVHEADKLLGYVWDFEPTTDAFHEFKADDGKSTGCLVRDGFRKLALHRLSVSGFGRMSGGPLGGRSQRGQCTIGSRWNPAAIQHAIFNAQETFRQFEHVRISNLHVRDVIRQLGGNCFAYLDPPYFVKGSQLYAYSMSDAEHLELAALLRETAADWLLSYDDCPQAREFYSWASIREVEIRYSNAVTSGRRALSRELVIVPPGRGGVEVS
jgi:DNA adenine methylase